MVSYCILANVLDLVDKFQGSRGRVNEWEDCGGLILSGS